MRVDIDGDGFAQHVERGGGGFGGLGGGGRTVRPHAAAEHRTDRRYHRTPHPLSAREWVAVKVTGTMTAAIHTVLPR
jgi:hypothetical protein